jgi:hypothetical protein
MLCGTKAIIVRSSLAAVSLLLISCGRSPLLNHSKETPPQTHHTAQTQQEENGETCRLSWTLNNETICANMVWLLPPIVGENRAKLQFNVPINHSEIRIWADMPDMGHGTLPMVVSQLDNNTLLVEQIWLTMNGIWVFHLEHMGQEHSWSIEL